jgi:hypothetical protein
MGEGPYMCGAELFVMGILLSCVWREGFVCRGVWEDFVGG